MYGLEIGRGAWAVSSTGLWARTLILRWNGSRWKQVSSPNPGAAGGDFLFGAATTSAQNAWAVGDTGSGNTVILHWNGRNWKQVRSPSPAASNALQAVSAASARSAWAAGFTVGGKALILRWNGTAWK